MTLLTKSVLISLSATAITSLWLRPAFSQTSYDLLLSTSSNRTNPAPLLGKSISGNICVFSSPENGVTRVQFFLDNPNMTGAPRQTENVAPYDFAGGSVASATPFNMDTLAAGSSSSALINGQMYVVGGIIGNSTTDQFAKSDPNTWTALVPMKQGRNHAAAATDGTKFYVFGGRGLGSGDGNFPANGFDTVQIYDPRTNLWTSSLDQGSTLAPLPQAQGGMGKAVYFNGEFYVMGGETDSGAGVALDFPSQRS